MVREVGSGLGQGLAVFGVHRSGTTLLQKILAVAPELRMIPEEIQGLKAFGYDFRKLVRETGDAGSEELVRALLGHPADFPVLKAMDDTRPLEEHLVRFLGDRRGDRVRALFDGMVSFFEKTANGGVLEAKYPMDPVNAHVFMDWYPTWRTVLIVRDPRAIIASKLRDPRSRDRRGSRWWRILRWATILAYVYEVRALPGLAAAVRPRGMVVRYEDLVADRARVVRELCHQLDLRFLEPMLEVSGKASSFGGEGARVPQEEKWKAELSRAEEFFIRRATAGMMQQFGYAG